MMTDTHAHLQWTSFDRDRDQVIGRARAEGVHRIVNIGFDFDGSVKALELAAKHEGLFATVGVHPHNANQFNEAILEELRKLSRSQEVVAIGEIGLDYYRDLSPREAQRRAFEAQLLLAKEVGLPAVVHNREAHFEIMKVISKFRGEIRGVMHCFSGSKEMAEKCVDNGFYISFAGPVTFPHSHKLQEVAKSVDVDRVLLETDSPWLAPQEKRGKRNEPSFLPFVAKKIAELRGMSLAELAEATNKNCEEIFRRI